MPRSFYAKLHRHFGLKESGYERIKKAEQKLAELLESLPILSYIDRNATKSSVKVAVVGAGFAGLSAAYILKKAGFEVDIFESKDRIGGRVSSSNIKLSSIDNGEEFVRGKVLEYGAELIGANHLLWLFFAKKFGLGINLMTTEDKFDLEGLEEPAYFGGKNLLFGTLKEILSQMEVVLKKITQDAEQIEDAFKPWLVPGAAILDNVSVGKMLDVYIEELIDEPHRKYLMEFMKFEFQNNNLTDVELQSYLGLLSSVKGGGGEDYWNQTELFRCARGNASLAEHFYKEIDQQHINLEHKLTRININKLTEKLTLGFSCNGQEETKENFDYLVLTIPTFKLTEVEVAENDSKVDGQEFSSLSIQAGNAVKHLTALKERFWIEKGLSPSGSHEKLGMIWEATDNQTAPEEDLKEENYVLTVFAGGEQAKEVIKRKSDIDFYIKDLMISLYPDYPHFSKKQKFVDWSDQNLSGGGYSCPTIGQVTDNARRLHEAYKERIFFAGEHTCMAFFGYMEGALQSGIRAAQRIALITGKTFDGLMLLNAENVNNEPQLKLRGYKYKSGKLELKWSPVNVQATHSDRPDRSDNNSIASVFFQNELYIAWTGLKKNQAGNPNYPNIVKATFSDESQKNEEISDYLKFSNKITFDKYKTKYPPALVVYDNKLFMGWIDEDNEIQLTFIRGDFSNTGTIKPIKLGLKSYSRLNFATSSNKLYMVWVEPSSVLNELVSKSISNSANQDKGTLKVAVSVDATNFYGKTTILVAGTFPEQCPIALTVFNSQLYLAWIDISKQKIYIMSSDIGDGDDGVNFNFCSEISTFKEEINQDSGLSMSVYNNKLYLVYTNNEKIIRMYSSKDSVVDLEFEPVSLGSSDIRNEGALGLIYFRFKGIS